MVNENDVTFKVKLDNKQFKKKFNEVDSNIEKVSKNATKNVKVLNAALITGGIILAAKAIAKVSAETIKLGKRGAQIKSLTDSYESLTKAIGVNSDKLLADLKRVSKGTIARTDLIQKSNEAILLTSGLVAKDLPKLLEIARASAKATGQDVTFLFDSIIKGIGRSSPLILDNLGLTVKIGEANEVYAKKLGKTVKELTKTEQQQALLNAVLLKGNKLIEDTGGNTTTMSDSWSAASVALKDLYDGIATKLGPALAGLANITTKVVNLTIKLFGLEQKSKLEKQIDIFKKQNVVLDQRKKQLAEQIKITGQLGRSIESNSTILKLGLQFGKLNKEIEKNNNEIDKLSKKLTNIRKPSKVGDEVFSIGGFIGELAKDAGKISGKMFTEGFVTAVKENKDILASVGEDVVDAITTGMLEKMFEPIDRFLQAFTSKIVNGFGELISSNENFAAFFKSTWEGLSSFFTGIWDFMTNNVVTKMLVQTGAVVAGALKSAIAWANQAAVGAYNAFASIPFIGPALGAAAYASTLAFLVGGPIAAIGGLAEGGIPRGDTMIAGFNPNERVMSAADTSKVDQGKASLMTTEMLSAMGGKTFNFDFAGADLGGLTDEKVKSMFESASEMINNKTLVFNGG